VLSALLVLVVAVGVAWTRVDATGGSSGAHLSASAIADATTAGSTARIDTVVQFGAAGAGTLGFETTGVVDFAHQRGDVITRPVPTKSSVQVPAGAQAETRWIGDDIYTKGGAFGTGGDGWAFVNAGKVRKASSCLAKIDVLSLVIGSGIESPEGVLESLRRQGKHLTDVGTEVIRGVPTTHWRVAPSNWPVLGCANSDQQHTKVRVGLDIWTDRQDRARRITLSQTQTSTSRSNSDNSPGGHGGNADDTVTQTSEATTDFFDFGATVAVQPPAGQVYDQTVGFISTLEGTGSVNRSDWHVAAHGTIGAQPWSVYAARTTTGWSC